MVRCKEPFQAVVMPPQHSRWHCFFLALGLYAFFRPDRLRMAMDRFADGYKRGRWHPYKMPLHVLRYGVGSVGIAGSALFFYIAHVAFTR
jgi:hypothetical protein